MTNNLFTQDNISTNDTLRDRVINNLELRRERILNNQINCIPSPFVRFSDDFVGIEQGRYFCVTSSTKGKFILI
jgi:hypothetical protein